MACQVSIVQVILLIMTRHIFCLSTGIIAFFLHPLAVSCPNLLPLWTIVKTVSRHAIRMAQ